MNQWTQRWETQSYQMALFCNSFHLKTSYNGFSEWSETFQLERFCRYRLQTAVKFLRLLLLWRQKQYFLETDKRTSYLQIVCIHVLRNSLFCPTLSIVIWFNSLQNIYKICRNISLLWHNIFTGVPFRWGRTLQLWNQEKRLTGKNFYFDEQKFQPFFWGFFKRRYKLTKVWGAGLLLRLFPGYPVY